MDVEAFSDDNFDAKIWINKTYALSENHSKESFVSTLVSKLQLYVEQVNIAVEDSSQKFLTNLPRVIKDAQNLQNEAMMLRTKMSEVQQEIVHVQKETGVCMSKLERLDNLKTTLQTAKQGLQESDGWGRLIHDLEDLLERKDLTKACDKLTVLQKSLAAQTGLPGQSDRETQVEGFKNRVEALASPAVVSAFSSCEIEDANKFVHLFSNMNRTDQLMQYYRQVQKTIIERNWIELVELSENSGSNRIIREFYDILIENYQKQIKWCTQVFGSTGNIEPVLVQCDLFSALNPSRETIVMNALKATDDKLSTLKEISNSNIYFGNSMKKHLANNQVNLTLTQQQKYVTAIYNYFNIFIGQYAATEQQNLTTCMSHLNLLHPTVAESIRSLDSSNGKIIRWAEVAIKNCDDITQNCAITSLVIVLNQFLKTYLEKFKKCQNQLRASRTSEQDWSLLQTCISFLQCVGDFKMSLDKLEKKLSNIILEVKDTINQQNDYDFCYKFQTKREINEFKKLVEIVNEYNENTYIPSLPNQNQCHGIFSGVNELIKPLCDEIHDITLASVFTPMEKHLKNLEISSSFNLSNTADLPDYSYAPQEYITQIGQYLLTLPQHLEPLLLTPSDQLKTALEICDAKYSRNIPSADILLSLIADECCAMYQEQIIQICTITPGEAKQLATDIEYLGSVLEELGISLNSHLQQIAALFRAPSDNYLTLSAGCDPKLVTAIRQMRNIVATEMASRQNI